MIRRVAAVLVLSLVVFLAGVFSGKVLYYGSPRGPSLEPRHHGEDPEKRVDGLRWRIARLEEARVAQEREIARLHRELAYEEVAASVQDDSLLEEELGKRELANLPLESLLDARAHLGDDDLHTSIVVDQEIRRRLVGNPEALEFVLSRFQAAPDHDLAALLGSFPHPETERVAVEMTAPGIAVERRLFAFEVLDRLDHISPESHAQLLDQLEYETDPEILGAALYALPHGVVAPELRERERSLLSFMAEHEDPDTRARALLVTGMGVPGDKDFDMLTRHLSDSAVAVRVTAAAALRNYRGRNPDAVIDALRSRMNDSDEHMSVRRQAWMTLSRMPMDEGVYAQWKELKHTLDGLGEIALNGSRAE